MINFTERDGAVILTVRVVPGTAKSDIVGEHDGALKIKLSASPVDGAANAELIKVLAKFFGVTKTDVEILSGMTARIKQIKIANTDAAKLKQI